MSEPIRNPTIDRYAYIGDCHLGRVFRNNVPLPMLGKFQRYQELTLCRLLKEALQDPQVIAVIQTGDWFDKALVSNNALLTTIAILEEWEQKHSKVLYILSGNHDDSKTTQLKSSWDLLEKIFSKANYVHFVKSFELVGENILLCGWEDNKTIKAGLEYYSDMPIKTVVCHLDKTSFGNDSNVIPYELLEETGVERVISGHEHVPYYFKQNGIEYIGTGSMLPYSHAEDPEKMLYHTFTNLEQVKNHFELPQGALPCHLRLYLTEAEIGCLPEMRAQLDAQYSVQVHERKEDEVIEDTEQVSEVIIETYNAQNIWSACADAKGLSQDRAQELWLELTLKGQEDD